MYRFIFVALILAAGKLCAQTKYFIYFTDKDGSQFDPYSYFDTKAIERRQKENISLYDISDYPVKEQYSNAVASFCDSVAHISRWLNGMSVFATEDQIEKIKQFDFVKDIETMQYNGRSVSMNSAGDISYDLTREQIALLKFQTYRHKAEEFRNAGLTGKGMRIAIFDVGFPGADTHPAFEKIRQEKRIIGGYDFISKSNNPYHGNTHGTCCFSCIAGYYDTIPIGMATDAEFLLAKTERSLTEFQDEEDAWLAAAEWADKNGADIISSSLAYTKQRYNPSDMNGRTSIVSKAAKIASDKGILVINAAGNEANNRWEYLATPADVEEVLTVGGVDPYTDTHIYFSSYGPNADGIIKPNVCSLGDAITATKNGYGEEFGTSFATPLTAGFAACAWQSEKESRRADIYLHIEQSAHLFPYYDYAHGYGIPQANYFTRTIQVKRAATFTTEETKESSDAIILHINADMFPDSVLANETKNLFYKFSDADGNIRFFSVIVPDEQEVIIHFPPDYTFNYRQSVFSAHFEGYTFTTTLNK